LDRHLRRYGSSDWKLWEKSDSTDGDNDDKKDVLTMRKDDEKTPPVRNIRRKGTEKSKTTAPDK
jgi:hypothetical protein